MYPNEPTQKERTESEPALTNHATLVKRRLAQARRVPAKGANKTFSGPAPKVSLTQGATAYAT